MTNRPLTRNDLIAATLIWMLVAVGLAFPPVAQEEARAVSCAHAAG